MMSTTSRVRASGLANGWPYQPSTTCGPLTPMPRIDPAAGEVVEGQRVHRDRRRRPAGHLHDRGAEPDPGGLAAPPGQRRERVGAPRLGGEDRVEPGVLRRGDQLADALRAAALPSSPAAVQVSSRVSFLRCTCLPQSRTCFTFAMTRTLQAPVTVAFDYTRSTGPVLGRFLTGLRDGVGRRRPYVGRAGRRAAARVRPGDPRGDRPSSSRSSAAGTVTSWTWVPEPVAGQPLDRPVRVRPGHPRRRRRPVAARARRRVPRRGRDRHAGPGALGRGAGRRHHRHRVLRAARRDGGAERASARDLDRRAPSEPVTGIITPVELDYLYAASPEESRSTAASARAGSSASAARRARRSTSRRAAPARPTACRPPTRSSCPTPAR